MLLDLLNKKRVINGKKVQRVVFNAITKKAVLDAMASAARNRRSAGRWLISPAAPRLSCRLQSLASLWRKLPGARSAGRVQSVALRLVCDREFEIERFITEEYWNLSALLKTPRGDEFEARLVVAMANGCSRERSATARCSQAEGAALRAQA